MIKSINELTLEQRVVMGEIIHKHLAGEGNPDDIDFLVEEEIVLGHIIVRPSEHGKALLPLYIPMDTIALRCMPVAGTA